MTFVEQMQKDIQPEPMPQFEIIDFTPSPENPTRHNDGISMGNNVWLYVQSLHHVGVTEPYPGAQYRRLIPKEL